MLPGPALMASGSSARRPCPVLRAPGAVPAPHPAEAHSAPPLRECGRPRPRRGPELGEASARGGLGVRVGPEPGAP